MDWHDRWFNLTLGMAWFTLIFCLGWALLTRLGF